MTSSKLCVFASLKDPTGHKIHDDLCEPPFTERGWRLESWPWTDGMDWKRADLVVLRSCYDYWEKPEQFRDWLHQLTQAGVPVINPPRTVLWNSNKKYLFELAALGCPTLRSLVVNPEAVNPGDQQSPTGQEYAVQEYTAKEYAVQEFVESCSGSREFICKPLIGAGGFEMRRLTREQTLDLKVERPSLLQPFEPGIADGEWSAIFLGGEPSHVVKKTAKLGEYRVQDTHGGTTTIAKWEDCPDLLRASKRVGQAIEALGFPTPEFARYDFVVEQASGQPILMEAELIEPTLFLEHQPGSADKLVETLLKAWKLGQH